VENSDTQLVLKKPNQLLVMVPTSGKLSPLARKLFNVLLRESHDQKKELDRAGRELGAKDFFRCKLSKLFAPFTMDSADLSTHAKKHLKEMQLTLVNLESPDQGTGVVYKSLPLVGEVHIDKTTTGLDLKWTLMPSMLEAIDEPALFTNLNLEYITSLRTYAAIALYEICVRYKNNPSGLTCSCAPDWWVQALTATAIRHVPGKKKREWRKVKSESVNDAILEINKITDIVIELIEKKTGKSVTQIQFAVRKKKVDPAAGAAAPRRLSPEVIERATKVGLQLLDVSNLVNATAGGEAVVRAAIAKLEQRAARDDLDVLDNKFAYLRSVTRELDGYAAPVAKKPRKMTPSSRLELVSEASITPQSMAKATVAALPVPEQRKLATLAFEEMKKRGIATPSITKAYAGYMNGGQAAGVLLAEMAKISLVRADKLA